MENTNTKNKKTNPHVLSQLTAVTAISNALTLFQKYSTVYFGEQSV